MKRDWNIVKAYKKEISLETRVTKNKKKYSRKVRYKRTIYENY